MRTGARPRDVLGGLEGRFGGRTFSVLCAFVALALLSPCVTTNWVADDLLHRVMLRPNPGIVSLARHPLDLFSFAVGAPDAVRQLVDAGVFPWWADPQAKLAFFRPVSSLGHWLDHALWPESAAAMHLHSLAWFGLLLAVVGAIYRRFSESRGLYQLTFLLFAVDDAHAPVVAWIANRNALIALCLALPALLLHDARRRGGPLRNAWLSPLALGLGLAAGETALVACAYLLSYALFLDQGSLCARLRALLPHAAVVIAWRILSATLGYGVARSGLYVDPFVEPLAYLRAACERLPVLALAQLALPWADFWEVFPLTVPILRPMVFATALFVVACIVVLVRPLWRRSPRVRFWSMGSLLALFPACATFPHDRVLLGAGVGAMAVVAELLRHHFADGKNRSRNALALAVVHLAIAPVSLPVRAGHVADLNRALKRADASLESVRDLRHKTLVLVNPPLDPLAAYLPIYREAANRPRPEHLLWLAPGVSEITLTTLDATTLRVRAREGFLSTQSQLMLRDPKRRFRAGDSVDCGVVRIEVRSLTADGRPLEIDAHFREPLESSRVVLLQWRPHGYTPLELLPIGGALVIPAVNVADALFG